MDTVALVVSARSKLTDEEYTALRDVILHDRKRQPPSELGKAIAERRIELDLSRHELAYRADISYSYVANIETGTRTPSLEVLGRLQNVLGMKFI